ncbi:hypothetical protein OV203_46835 [Nannocystis sp. ILAH1]|uniref:hypothetical protein n=1 Tax=Nannocystis sp. ILAH1 TaxID=2996789 RepID=UPI00227044A9|nr:hypothetical protein [Nannocystis sp. ILAH1]MCY0994732.1 hypothetical protein [Nannocystis sp. ILAH1]
MLAGVNPGVHNPLQVELGQCVRPDRELVEVAAGASTNIIAVAEGMGGHGCGWLGARRVVHAVVAARGDAAVPPTFVGAASERYLPEARRRWFGAHANVEVEALPLDLAEAFVTLDRKALSVPMPAGPPLTLAVGCIAITLDGVRVYGAHAGPGRAVVLRRGSTRPEELVGPQLVEGLPFEVVANAIGMLASSGRAVERFETALAAGDVLLASSRPLAVDDTDFLALVDAHVDAPLAALARAIESRVGDARSGGDAAFTLVRCVVLEP